MLRTGWPPLVTRYFNFTHCPLYTCPPAPTSKWKSYSAPWPWKSACRSSACWIRLRTALSSRPSALGAPSPAPPTPRTNGRNTRSISGSPPGAVPRTAHSTEIAYLPARGNTVLSSNVPTAPSTAGKAWAWVRASKSSGTMITWIFCPCTTSSSSHGTGFPFRSRTVTRSLAGSPGPGDGGSVARASSRGCAGSRSSAGGARSPAAMDHPAAPGRRPPPRLPGGVGPGGGLTPLLPAAWPRLFCLTSCGAGRLAKAGRRGGGTRGASGAARRSVNSV